MNELRKALAPVHHGLGMGLLALIFGVLWVAYIATHHEQLHGGFEAAEAQLKQAHLQSEMNMDMMSMETPSQAASAHTGHNHQGHNHEGVHQHSHSGSLATDSMQRLIRGHIHFMGVGLLVILMLILVASTSLKDGWKKTFAWTFGLGALMYPPAWILMGFRTVELGPQGAEASVMWLFGPAVALLIGSLIALLVAIIIEYTGLQRFTLFAWAFKH
ncbi:MAG: hypothetical protein R8K49_09500 [Mariprofundaceae bacterium]